ncbi:MAG: hypothetical protein KF914_12405 [Rhizobiaceae bacterium]|nr:hypothetical protein [Rhizobiaceae bacterium]
MELAVYTDRDNIASLDFRPTDGAAAVTNRFRMAIGGTVLDGMVMWSQGVQRPNGMLTLDCPDGDVTGPEYEACTLWQGVIYGVDDKGEVGLLPAQGTAAPPRLIFPDLAYGLAAGEDKPGGRFAALPWDVFSLSGCQE